MCRKRQMHAKFQAALSESKITGQVDQWKGEFYWSTGGVRQLMLEVTDHWTSMDLKPWHVFTYVKKN